MPRPTLDETLISVASTWAQRSTCSRLQVGAVLARDGRTLSTGYNGAPAGEAHCRHDDDSSCVHSVHAEANALVFAARHGVSTEGASMYITHAPCLACSGLLLNAGIRAVVYRDPYRNGDGLDRLAAAGVELRKI